MEWVLRWPDNSRRELAPVPNYENVMIARQDISAAQVEALTDQFAGILTEAGGQVSRREYWGLRNLAYRVKKNRKGHYVLLNFDAPSEAVLEMERNMGLNEDVLRYLTVRTDDLPETPSIVMQRRDDRDRGSRGGRFDSSDRGGRRGPPEEKAARPDSEAATAETAKAAEPAADAGKGEE